MDRRWLTEKFAFKKNTDKIKRWKILKLKGKVNGKTMKVVYLKNKKKRTKCWTNYQH